MTKQIAVLVGSGSKTSYNQIVAKHLVNIAPANLQLNLIDISKLPLYDRDLDENSPAEYEAFRQAIAQADGVIFVTPEHNGGFSAMIKNAIDVGSRPMGQSKWIGKPAGLVSVSASGSNRPLDQLRTIASGAFINMPVAPFGATVGGIFSGAFNEQGELTSEQGLSTLQNFINAYADFVAKF
ncbi:NADPH-dependent FMN reductase [Conservatibacter flavescens]|uniref:FMN reductase n=1 Tax=Conservatibacter flavescens TaxID=28161 RepID=A0A2M8S5F8_9PAST|nr:NAD(P)H-dependent oxidoreductase [Conservatibacter flavescens]PJG86392.1 FMN reductase [Conservatibacter flavescens]